MLSSSGCGAISGVTSPAVYRTGLERENRTRGCGESSNKFDSVTLSAPPTGEGRFHMALVGRLSQEVRTTTTTGDINALRQQVAEHRYVPDPTAIARRIMFLED